MNSSVLASVLLFTSVVYCQSSQSRRFGDHINWKTLDSGLQSAKLSQKPVMVLIHRTNCPACHELQPKFAASKEIADLSSQFEMVNVADEEEPQEAKYSPDGGYVPRILFFAPHGEFKGHVNNPKGHPQYKYYHYDTPSIVAAMNSALSKS